MAKHNIELDLLKILRKKDNNEVFYVILNMINGTYEYELNYLNKVPYDELMVHLEKIITVIENSKGFNNKSSEEAIIKFAENLSKLKYVDLNDNKLVNLEYYLKLKLVKAKEMFSKKNLKRSIIKASSVILTILICSNIYKEMKKEEINSLDINIAAEYVGNELEKNEVIVYEDVIDDVEVEKMVFKKEEVKLTKEDKVSNILDEYNLSQEEFDVLCAIVLSEAKGNSYEDAYSVINTIYNRTISKKWVEYISDFYGKEVGDNLYYQAITPGQFVVYEDGVYKKNMGIKEGPAYDAIIDFLTTKEIKHNYLSFRASYCDIKVCKQFVDNGNKYFNEIEEEDRIIAAVKR